MPLPEGIVGGPEPGATGDASQDTFTKDLEQLDDSQAAAVLLRLVSGAVHQVRVRRIRSNSDGAVGEEFNPHFHEAVSTEEQDPARDTPMTTGDIHARQFGLPGPSDILAKENDTSVG